MTDLREQEMQNRIDTLAGENQYLKEQIAQLRKIAFGAKTEKSKRILGDCEEFNLFNEAEVEEKASVKEPTIEVPAHQRRKNSVAI